ncbi:MAG: beta-lactamase family protein [Verrucomicrobia bacterium]|nr:beta-lactamase family protein [Verrucomicrobiota bacterium]MCH8512867.1 beta-lactamase family protein [Kiritimatiellia bacterium]
MSWVPSLFLLEDLCHAWRLPGIVVCGFDRKGVETASCGWRDYEAHLPMVPETRFPLASITKTFTTDLLLRAAGAGRVDLDAPIIEQLPGFALADLEATARMTPRDAACHYSGLPPHTWAWVFGDRPRQAFIRERLPHLASEGPFREKHRYSNLMYAVLGQLIETGTGPDWEAALEMEILRPLGLHHTGILSENWADAPMLARPYADGDRPRKIPFFVAKRGHLIAPASEMVGTVPDLATWGQALFKLSPEDERWQPHNEIIGDGMDGDRPLNLGPLHYGLGWRLDRVGGSMRVWHSGQCSGYSLLLSLMPETGTGHVYACNRSGAVGALQALDFLQKTGKESGIFCPPPPRLTPDPAHFVPTGPKALPHGVYGNPGYGCLEVGSGAHTWIAWQNSGPVPVEIDSQGAFSFKLPIYGARFEIRAEGCGVQIPFQRGQAPIRFEKVRIAS